MIGDECRAETEARGEDNDADQFSAAPALCEMQKLHHTRHVVRSQQISRNIADGLKPVLHQ